ncbi:MAG TPA: 8-oxo-dGTP diphosphatase [Candidatus Paceibacterota bacterium]|uniref:Oxidized purine nucleoside triphosphate hydrolase n=1 Tax=Candidatus Liptonbacteria bacterium RIFCSPLOWO2_01_FULL_45_15 TaxID=1798649 RepID=A0A1G2CKQ2_9BACT|nr:MAG: DNA mismatch repair protein MutT [Candidatus Liptonbacteria bacterium RIFCSPLOWO2_01_FULL_45_15]
MKNTTLCFLVKENKVLLAMKKRGFGAGKWNGVGGKITEGEDIKDATIREANEEIGVTINAADLKNHGSIKFSFENNPDWNQEVHIFITEKWEGEPAESEEMKPQWYLHSDLPFSEMWLDDPYWLPKVLAGKKVEGEFFFNNNGSEILKFDVREMD